MTGSDLVMSFDFGTKKIGVAVGQSVTGTATPIKILMARDGIPNWQEVKALIEDSIWMTQKVRCQSGLKNSPED